MSKRIHGGLSPIGRQLYEKFGLFDIDVIREDYSCTIEFPDGLSDTQKTILERKGFEVIHEEGPIYTLKFEFQQ